MTSAAPSPVGGHGPEVWDVTDALGYLRRWAAGELPEGAHARHTGNRVTEVLGEGEVVFTWTPGPQLANPSGNVHGGYVALVCDEVCGVAASARGPRFVPVLTLDLDVTYLRPGLVGVAHRVEGHVVHFGRTRIVSEARIFWPDGSLAASARGSFVPNRAYLGSATENNSASRAT